MLKRAITAVRRAASTPRLKKPRTSGDFEAITRAQLKRGRKARKLRWDNAIHLATYYFTREGDRGRGARRLPRTRRQPCRACCMKPRADWHALVEIAACLLLAGAIAPPVERLMGPGS